MRLHRTPGDVDPRQVTKNLGRDRFLFTQMSAPAKLEAQCPFNINRLVSCIPPVSVCSGSSLVS
eukprot:scaffold39600_cov46-Cyclotella_meneghiniana.AAC.1